LLTVAGLQLPVIPFVEVPGNAGTDPPEQIVSEFPKLNTGIVLALTVTVKVAAVAHCPADGVNVYTADAVLLTVEGLHVPVIPFPEVVVNAGTDPPSQIVNEVPKANAGVTLALTVTVYVAVVAHCPASGVNVYTSELVLSTVAGFHVPVIPLEEVAGNAGTVPPEHTVNVVPKLNEGVMLGFTVTAKLPATAHCPASGVNA
jgi:hypothetical protein